MKETTFIYTISDEFGVIRYVGKSNNPKNRIYHHINEKSNIHKYNWLRSIIKRGKFPTIEVIEEVPNDSWEMYEIYWISQFKAWGFNLLNLTIGGEGGGGYIHTEISKKKMSKSKLGSKLSKEHKLKISNSIKILSKDNPLYNRGNGNSRIILNKDELYQKYIIENLSLNKCASYFSVSKKTVFTNITEYNFKKNKEDWKHQLSTSNRQIICQYDINGKLISEWDGYKSIENKLGYISSSIVSCCSGRTNQSYGYLWRIKGDNIIRNRDLSKHKKSVFQYDKDGKLVDEYPSLSHASRVTNIQRSAISYCCKGVFKSAGGFTWTYKI